MEAVLAKIGAVVFFAGSAALTAVLIGHLAHDAFHVSRVAIRETAFIFGMVIGALVVIDWLGDTIDNRR